MREASRLLVDPILLRLGLALAHFVWQGAALAAVAALALVALRKAKPAPRYLVLLGVMLAMVVCPVVTFTRVTAPDPAVVSARAAIARFATTHAPPTRARQGRATPAPTREPPPVSLRQRVSTPVLSCWQWLQPRLSWAVLTWTLGVVLLSLRLLLRWRSLGSVRREGQPLEEDRWVQMLARLIETVQVSRPVQLLQSSLARVPTTLGWLRPVVLLPASALTGLTPRQLEAVIAHELAHIRRYDYLVNLAQTVVETLLFYHPAVWWVSHRIRLEREHCCDELAVTACGNARTYAAALVQLAHAQSLPLAVAASGGSLSARLHRLAGTRTRQHALVSWIAAIPPALAIAALVIAVRAPLAASARGIISAWAGYPGEFVVCSAVGDQVRAAVSGDVIVWIDYRNAPSGHSTGEPPGHADIYGYDIRTGRESAVCIESGDQLDPSIDGNLIVWTDYRSDADGRPSGDGTDTPDIYGYDLTTGEEFAICTVPGPQRWPDVSGDIVVWDDGRNWVDTGLDIRGIDLARQQEFVVCDAQGDQVTPVIDGTLVFWQDYRNHLGPGPENSDIYGRDLSGGPELVICTEPSCQELPDVSGRYVVWQDYRHDIDGWCAPGRSEDVDIDVYGYNLDTARESLLATGRGRQLWPAICGGKMVCIDARPGAQAPMVRDLVTGTTVYLSRSITDHPAISGELVVWQDERMRDKTGSDIYACRLPD
jgi:beta-lactamase regulating signal transducer with metallopeptidase domain